MKRKNTPKKSKKLFSKITPVILKFVLISAVLLVSFFIIYSLFLPQTDYQKTRQEILRNPNNLEARLKLVQIYLDNNQFQEAEKELKKIQRFKGAKAQGELIEKLRQRKLKEDPEEIKKQIEKWHTLLKDYPDYRDAWLQLALLYTHLGEKENAQEAIRKALNLSPNYETAQELEKTILNTEE